MNYRREIDGLRAIAVLAVILFHAKLGVKGGFVGVDIFFVISGYLITSIILSECEAGTFTLAGFYERRVRRILPALFFVLLCCLPAAYFLLLPDQTTRFAKSFLSGLFFVSNYYFRGNVGYFQPDADEEPLLHLWSLAVEEQYYIFFPLLALLLWHMKERKFKVTTLVWQRRFRVFIAVVALIAVASFIYAVSELGAETLFYDTRGRIWELLIGSLLAIYLRKRAGNSAEIAPHGARRLLAEYGSALGLLLILAACFGINRTKPFPGYWALFPTLGAALVILFASPNTWAGRLLSSRVLVGIGLISYSAYLWHWSLFAFTRVVVHGPSRWLFAGLSLLSLGLAFVSWRYVERPFRDRKLFQRPQIFRFAAISATLLIAVGCVGLSGIPSRFTADADLLVPYQERVLYSNRYNKLRNNDPFSNEQKLRVLLLGDSFSADIINAMAERGLLTNAEIKVRFVLNHCQVYLGKENWMDLIDEQHHVQCANEVYTEDFYSSLQPLIQNADIVILVSSWYEWAARRLPETIKNLQIPDSTRVIVIGTKNFGKIRIRDYIGLSIQEKAGLQNNVNGYLISMNKILRTNLKDIPNVEFVDLHELACGKDSKTCPIFSSDGKLLSYDGGHLTQAGAAYVGGLLKEHPVFKAFEDTSSITDSQ